MVMEVHVMVMEVYGGGVGGGTDGDTGRGIAIW